MFIDFVSEGSGLKLLHRVDVLSLQMQFDVRQVVTPSFYVLLGHIENLDLIASLLLHGSE